MVNSSREIRVPSTTSIGLACNQPDAKKSGTCAVYGLPGDPCDGTTTVCRPGGVCDVGTRLAVLAIGAVRLAGIAFAGV